MLLKTAGLLLAGLSLANAGILQRQCLPTTVTVTALAVPNSAAAPVISAPGETTTITLAAAPQTSTDTTTTVTVTQTETETTTVTALPQTTFTSVFTNFVTVHYTTVTVSGNAPALPSGSPATAVGSPETVPALPSGSPATTTVQVLLTETVIPVPAVPTEFPTEEPTTISTTTVVIHATSTEVITDVVTVPSEFPTLSVTGTMGITPSVYSGSAIVETAGFGTGTGGALAGTGSPISGSSYAGVILLSASAPPFANTTVLGAATSPSAAFLPGTAGSTASLARRCHGPLKRGLELGLEKNRRQVGAVVTATIDGVVVSWTNTWSGAASTTIDTAVQASQTPVQSTAVVVTATIDGSVVSWTQSIVPTAVTIAPTPTSTYTALGGPVPVIVSSSSFDPLSMAPSPTDFAPTTLTATTGEQVSSSATTPPAASLSGLVPGYAPPAWLTSEFPFPPETTLQSTLSTVSSIAANSSTATSTAAQSVITSASNTTSPIAAFTTTALSAPAISTTASVNATTSASLTTSAQPTCTGQFQGNFTITFDDLPRNGEPASSNQYPPFQNPYQNLYWSQGYSYAPPPQDPYLPHGTQLGVFEVDGSANVHSQNWTGPIPNDTDVNGMFGAGPNFADPAFYIDVFSAYVGCENPSNDDCQIQALGYALEEPEGSLGLQVEQYFYVPPCSQGCSLQLVQLGEAFRNLTAFQIQATRQGDESDTALTWYVDDIDGAWSDNSCEAVQAREQASRPGHPGTFVKRPNIVASNDKIFWQSRVPVAPSKKRATGF